MQTTIREKQLKVFAVDASVVAEAAGLIGANTVMLTCFLHLTQLLLSGDAAQALKQAAQKAYAKAGEKVIEKPAIDAADALNQFRRAM